MQDLRDTLKKILEQNENIKKANPSGGFLYEFDFEVSLQADSKAPEIILSEKLNLTKLEFNQKQSLNCFLSQLINIYDDKNTNSKASFENSIRPKQNKQSATFIYTRKHSKKESLESGLRSHLLDANQIENASQGAYGFVLISDMYFYLKKNENTKSNGKISYTLCIVDKKKYAHKFINQKAFKSTSNSIQDRVSSPFTMDFVDVYTKIGYKNANPGEHLEDIKAFNL